MNRVAIQPSEQAYITSSPQATVYALPANSKLLTAAMLLLLTLAAPLIHGYHVGIEDQGIYLPAVKQHLQPQLYSRDTELFAPQTRPTLFDEAVAFFSQLTHLPLEATMLLWHLASIYLLLWAACELRGAVLSLDAHNGYRWPWLQLCLRLGSPAQGSLSWMNTCIRAHRPPPCFC